MKKQILIFTAVVCGMTCTTTAYAQFKIGGKKINVGKVVQAGTDAAKAITLSDADIAAMSREYMQWMDTHNPLTKPDTEYGKRLEKLTGHIKEVDGLKVNFGVYEVVDVNAFACGDGSVRICAGLMDIMTDDEVMAVVGHEIGHVIHTDSKDAMKNAYIRSAVKNAAGIISEKLAQLTESQLGTIAAFCREECCGCCEFYRVKADRLRVGSYGGSLGWCAIFAEAGNGSGRLRF